MRTALSGKRRPHRELRVRLWRQAQLAPGAQATSLALAWSLFRLRAGSVLALCAEGTRGPETVFLLQFTSTAEAGRLPRAWAANPPEVR